MENYIPISLLQLWWATGGGEPMSSAGQRRREAKVSVFAGLPVLFRHQLHMKEGLAANVLDQERKRELKAERASLSRHDLAPSLPDSLLEALLGGRDPSALDELRTGFKEVHRAWHLDEPTVERALHDDGDTPEERAALEQERRVLLESLLSRL